MRFNLAFVLIGISSMVGAIPSKDEKKNENYTDILPKEKVVSLGKKDHINNEGQYQGMDLSQQGIRRLFSEPHKVALQNFIDQLKSFVNGKNLEVRKLDSQAEVLKKSLSELEKTFRKSPLKKESDQFSYALDLFNTMMESAAKLKYLRKLGGPGTEQVSWMVGVILGCLTLQNPEGTLNLLLEDHADQVLELWRVVTSCSKTFESLTNVSVEVCVMFEKHYSQARDAVDNLVGQIIVPFQ